LYTVLEAESWLP